MQIVLAVTGRASASAQELGEALKAGWLSHQSRDQLQIVPYSWGYSEVSASYPIADIFPGRVDPEEAGKRLVALLEAGNPLYLPACHLGQSLQSEYLSPEAAALVNLEELPDFPSSFIRGVARAYGQENPDPQIWENLGRALAHTVVVTGSPKPLFSPSGVLATIAKTHPEIAQKTKENWETILIEAQKFGHQRYLELSKANTSGKLQETQIGTLPAGGCAWGIGELLGRLGARLDFAADFLDEHTRLPQVLENADLLVANIPELSPWNLPGSPVAHLSGIASKLGLPIVVVTSKNNLSRPEMAEQGIDGVYQFSFESYGMKEAGLRLARTWSR